MNKATFILLVTTQLLCNAASEYQKWTEVEHTFGVKSCWKILKDALDKECETKGGSTVENVNFTACKMGCKTETENKFVNISMPNNTSCGLYNETCQNGICVGHCSIPEETLEELK
uniref:Putative secreted protein n=1 Tax=Ixodes ricinus TaxID=34613 RepID=V5HM76_IXORI